MQKLIYDAGASIQQLLDKGFQMPIHCGVGRSAVIAGTYNFCYGEGDSTEQYRLRHGNALDVTGNFMYVDSQR